MGQIAIKVFQLFRMASTGSVQKAVDLTTPAKNRRKMRIIDLRLFSKL